MSPEERAVIAAAEARLAAKEAMAAMHRTAFQTPDLLLAVQLTVDTEDDEDDAVRALRASRGQTPENTP